MDETFKRRLIGAGLLLLAAFLLASMLPEPRLRKARDPDQNVVTIELQEPDRVATQDVASVAVNPMPKPVVGPDTDVTRDRGADPKVDEPTDSPGDTGEAETPPDIESGDRSTLVAPTPTATPRPSPRSSPQAAQQVTQQAAVQAPAPSAVPTPSPVRVAVASPSTTPPPAAAGGARWWIQIGSYSDIANARVVETRMRAIGQAVVIAPIDTRSGVLYRVRCGPYASQAAGQEVHARVVAAGYPEARVVSP